MTNADDSPVGHYGVAELDDGPALTERDRGVFAVEPVGRCYRAGDRFREMARRAGPLPFSMMAVAKPLGLKRDLDTEEGRRFWANVEESAEVVRDAPDWMKGGINLSDPPFVSPVKRTGCATVIGPPLTEDEEPSVGDVGGDCVVRHAGGDHGR